MANEYITGFYFSLCMPGSSSQSSDSMDTAFQDVSGLSKEIELEEVVCGGENRFKYKLPKTTKFGNLVLKRGVCFNSSPLIGWCMDTLDNGMAVSIKTKNLQLSLLNESGQSCRLWNFINAYPVKWSGSELNAEKSALFIETIEFAYQYFDIDDGDNA
ncbi:MAG: phage tail protein [Gammaproteobacteria bacterium]|nr:phage tail protein [Gammaproteobacteria bacterium]